jgi:hypothetical protein
MKAEEVLRLCGDVSALENVSLHWDESMAAYPGGSEIVFLRDDEIVSNSRACGFDDEVTSRLLSGASKIRSSEYMSRLAWHCYWRIFLSEAPCPPSDWPEPAELGEERGILYLLVGIGYVPLVRENHRQLGLPLEVALETVAQVKRFCDCNYSRAYKGRLGVFQSQLGWMRYYTKVPYIRLGRLEYWLQPLGSELFVYRERETGKTIAFLPDGLTCLANGLRLAKPEEYEGLETRLTKYRDDGEKVIGTPVNPRGFVDPREVVLPRAKWDLVFKKGDMSLGMHIPSGGKMTFEECQKSLERAKEFFKEYFPDKQPVSVVCNSWIFNPELQEIFGPEANLNRFQRGLYLVPNASRHGDGLWFIFLKQGPFDLDTAPAETSLQRGILDFLKKGRRWRSGQMFILMDDIDRFCDGTYLEQFDEVMEQMK